MNSEQPSSSGFGERPLLHGVDWAVRAGAAEEIMQGTRRRVRQRRQRRLAFGAVGCAIAGIFWLSSLSRPAATGTLAPASVVVSLPARQTLPDGSLVELKEGAEISAEYSASARRVVLVRGEAHFQVTADPARPFIVVANSIEVRAVGTAFSVQRLSAQVEVIVTHGRVAVDRVAESAVPAANPAPATIATLDAGNRTTVEVADISPAVVEALSPVEVAQRLAWRTARLEFTRTPLAEALPMINAHSEVKVSLADASLAGVQISGLLRANSLESLFRLLEAEHGIRAERRSPTQVVLRSGR